MSSCFYPIKTMNYDSANRCRCVWILRLCWEILHWLFPAAYGALSFPPCPTGWRKHWKSWASSPPLAPINANVSSFCRVFGFSLRCFGPLLWKTQLSESESGDCAVTRPELTTSLFPRWGHGGCRQPARNHTAVFVIHVSNLTVLLTRHLQSCSPFEKTQTWNYSFQWVVDHSSDSSEHLLMKHLVLIGSEVFVYKVLPNHLEFKFFKNIKSGIMLLIFKVVIEDVEIILGVLWYNNHIKNIFPDFCRSEKFNIFLNSYFLFPRMR